MLAMILADVYKRQVSSLGYTDIKVDLYKNKVIGTIRVHVSEK